MKRRKKKGSSLLTVVVIFAVLATLGAAMLTLTGTDYNLRIKESKRVQNLYSSDSGLDVVYAGVKQIINNAIVQGNAQAATTMTNIQNNYHNTAQLDQQDLKTQLKNSFETGFKNNIDYNNIITRINNKDLPNVSFDSVGNVTFLAESMTGHTDFTNSDNKIEIKVTSTFSNNGSENTRKVSAILAIAVPDYVNPYSVSSIKEQIAINSLWDNAIAIEGNMIIKGNFTVNGQAYVKGNNATDNIGQLVYDKYNGGVHINADTVDSNNISVAFDTLITPSNLRIHGIGAHVTVSKDLYAKNVYLGKISSTDIARNCSLNVTGEGAGSIYTVNDLALNGESSTVTANNYYGVNDLEYQSNDVDGAASDSSSIIVNSDDIGRANGSSITINNDAYIMGVAYINNTDTSSPLNEPYKTGESVAIKGNYKGYGIFDKQHTDTASLNSNESSLVNAIHYLFDGFLPVRNFDSSYQNGRNLTTFDKSDYINLYDRLYNTESILKKSGVNLRGNGTIMTIGSYFTSDNQIHGHTFDPTTSYADVLKPKLQQYWQKCLHMNISIQNDDYFDANNDTVPSKEDILQKVLMYNTVGSDAAQKIMVNTTRLNFTPITDRSNIRVFNNKNVVIIGNGVNDGDYDYNSTTDTLVDLRDYSTNMATGYGMIVTTGNVKVYGKVDFHGMILAGGDFVDGDPFNKTFSYDRNYVDRAIALSVYNHKNDSTQPDYQTVFNYTPDMSQKIQEASINISQENALSAYHVDGTVEKLSNWSIVR